jgi:hypothetical protein
VSYWVDLEVVRPSSVYNVNMTWNYSPMTNACGFHITDFHGKHAGETIPILTQGLAFMRENEDKVKALEPPNGYGTYEHLIVRIEEMLAIAQEYPKGVWNIN